MRVPAIVLTVGVLATSIGGLACSSNASRPRPEGPFVVPLVQQMTTKEGGGVMLSAAVGQPVFLVIQLNSESGGEMVEVGIDGSTLSESSYCVLVSRQMGPSVERKPAAPAKSLTLVALPPDRRSLNAVVPLWFGDPGADGVRPLIFSEPGRYYVRLRFHHVLKQPKFPHERPEWYQVTSPHEVIIDVENRDPAAVAFSDTLAPFIEANNVVSSHGRPLLRKYAHEADPPVKAWAQWMLLRSYAMDAGWWEAVRKGDAAAGEALDRLTPLARKFVQDEAHRFRPPRYDALVILAARAARDGNRELALDHLNEARRRYGGMMLPRDVIGLGEALPSTQPTTQAADAG